MGAPARAERLVPAVFARHRGARHCQSDGHDASGIDDAGYLGESAAVALLDRAVIQVLTDRRQLTPDLGGTGTTTTVADEVLAQVRRGSGR